jgi:hypothetical protein
VFKLADSLELKKIQEFLKLTRPDVSGKISGCFLKETGRIRAGAARIRFESIASGGESLNQRWVASRSIYAPLLSCLVSVVAFHFAARFEPQPSVVR